MATLKLDQVKKMSLVELNNAMNTEKGLTTVMKQAIQVRIKALSAPQEASPVATIQEGIAAESTTTEGTQPEAKPAEITAVVVEKKAKAKPMETTRTIEKFTGDAKGIRSGSMVTFAESKSGTGKTLTGQVQRLFDFYDKKRSDKEEAKIMVTSADGKSKTRFYREEKNLTLVVPTPVEEVKNEEVPEVVVPEVVEEPKA